MTNPQQFYMPKNPDFLDSIGYTQRVVDAILRNNPLTDAVVSHGLIKWIGNYTNAGNPDKINFLWIGEFLPADTNLPGNPAQRGFSLLRDDSRGGRSAIALYDPNPAAGGGLRQQLLIGSGDGQRLIHEHRDGGWAYPETNVAMGERWSDLTRWPSITSGSFDTLAEGRCSVIGNRLSYRMFAATTNGASAEFRMKVVGFAGDILGTTHTLGTNSNGVFDSFLDISSQRGTTVPVIWEARVTGGGGEARTSVISVRNYTV